MGNERVDFSRIARDRILAAQAAIAAAETSAMNAYAEGSFHDAVSPVAPWVASPVKGQDTFAERLRKHEAHLNTIKNALPFESADPRVYQTSAPAESHMQGNKAVNQLQLPPWSQPAQLPSFNTFQKSGTCSCVDMCFTVLLRSSSLRAEHLLSLQIQLQANTVWRAPAGFQQLDRVQRSAGLDRGWSHTVREVLTGCSPRACELTSPPRDCQLPTTRFTRPMRLSIRILTIL